jgi:hypothetical protein
MACEEVLMVCLSWSRPSLALRLPWPPLPFFVFDIFLFDYLVAGCDKAVPRRLPVTIMLFFVSLFFGEISLYSLYILPTEFCVCAGC